MIDRRVSDEGCVRYRNGSTTLRIPTVVGVVKLIEQVYILGA
jgi:hypothetical protein